MGRITEVIKGKDDKVRVADVTSCQKIYRRPITKLARLPIITMLICMMLTGIYSQEITPLNASSIYFSHLGKIIIINLEIPHG
jgi:hypothetical protein